MNREEKQIQIAEIRDRFSRMAGAILADFRGVDVQSVTKLRDSFREQGVEYRVVKNTLFELAVRDEPFHDAIKAHLTGPTGVAWSYDDPSAPAKVAVGFAKDNKNLTIKCAVLDGEVLEGERVVLLSKMPGKDELLSSLLATFVAPAQGFVRLLAAAPTNFVYLLDARRRQLEE